MADKGRYWVAVTYPENMIEDWQIRIDDILQRPYAYCIHDKDMLQDGKDDRKVHVHIMIAFANTTTYQNALTVFEGLSLPDKSCCNTCQRVVDVRHMYDYLIHDTDGCRKQNKYLYDPSERVTGNRFDIGCYEQISIEQKLDMRDEILSFILDNNISDYRVLLEYVVTLGREYISVLSSYNALYHNAVVGNYQHQEKVKRENYDAQLESFKHIPKCNKTKHKKLHKK